MLVSLGKARDAVRIPPRLMGVSVSLALAGGALLCAYLLTTLSERKSVEVTDAAVPAAAETVMLAVAVQSFEIVQQTKGNRLTEADPSAEAEDAPYADAEPLTGTIPMPRPRPDRVAGLAAQAHWRIQLASAEMGLASYYQPETLACGGAVVPNALTAAHKSLPCGTVVKVTNTKNGHYAMVQINDRGPFIRGRVIDVGRAAAHDLDMIGPGVVPVSLEVMR